MYIKKAYGYVLPYDKLSPVSKSLRAQYDPPEIGGNYNKQWVALLVIQKSAAPGWVKWTHHSEGKTHCDVCLKLDGCWFLESKSPVWPHHPFCHCTLDPIDYAEVLMHAKTYSEYSKFDPYLFDPDNVYKHGKNRAFESWGYTVDDARWLQAEIEKQVLEKYIAGDYALGKLNKYGQRINIKVTIQRKGGTSEVSFTTGWMVKPNGKLKLNTPYGGK